MHRAPRPLAALRAPLLLLLAALAPAPSVAASGSLAAQGVLDARSCRTDYVIRARIDVPEHRLDGSAQITWRNESGDTVEDLFFHLYHNAFSNNRSTHLSEDSRRRRPDLKRSELGWQRIRAISVGGEDVLPSLEFSSPHPDESDGTFVPASEERVFSTEDRTVFKVDLPGPVRSGETITIDLEWESLIPRVRRRTGHRDDFFLMAHWFPKLGVYEGGRGWNCHRFHANTEFYADYGTYDVTLDLPKEYEDHVFGSGLEESSRVAGDRVEVRFLAPTEADRERVDATGRKPLVHGFAWTADPDYVVREFSFVYDEWAERYASDVLEMSEILGEEGRARLRDVKVSVLIQPEREAQAERHFEATSVALFFYGLWFGEYPYEHITVVDPAWGARGAGGMEYPTLFTCGTRLFTFPGMHSPESVTVHEAGHQFWYGLVGNNEFEASWLDEGFNSFTDSEALFKHYGPSHGTTDYARVPFDGVRVAPLPGGSKVPDALLAGRIELPFDFTLRPVRSSGFVDWWRDQPLLTLAPERDDPRWTDRSGYLRAPDVDPIDTLAYDYRDGESYGTNSYRRTAASLRTLMAVVGREAFLRGMRHYSETWRYRHPYPQDFFDAFVEGSGVDCAWYFEDVFRGTSTVDWEVSVRQKRVPDREGWFPDETGELVLIGEGEEGPPLDDESAEEEPDDEDEPGTHWLVEIVVQRHGELRLPLPIEWTFAAEDADSEPRKGSHVWTREEQEGATWWRLRLESRQKLESVVLDPERGIYLDGDMSDNQWFAKRERLGTWRWAERVFTQYAHQMHWRSRLGG